MTWTQWVRQPQTLWVRRALFQLHLWSGIILALYVIMLGITGSVLVYRAELNAFLGTPRPAFEPNARKLSADELREAAARAYPGWTVADVGDRITRRNPTASVYLERGDEKKQRLLNPYTGEDLGDSMTQGEWMLLRVAELHDDLLFDRTGRFWNGIGSIVFTASCTAGLILWWPGKARWKRSLQIRRSSGWRRFNWDLHSAIGFWLSLFLLMWGISGIYLSIPDPFAKLVDYISDPNAAERTGDTVLFWLTRLHFGRWRAHPSLKVVWFVLGLVPALMAVTGVIMWWNRVIRRRKELSGEV